MNKTKILYTICAAALCVATMIGVYATAVSTDAEEAVVMSLVIESESLERYYDGTPLKSDDNGAKIISGSLEEGDSIKYQFNASQTNVGSIENIVTATIVNSEGVDVTPKYGIEYRNGTLKVNQRQLSIATDSASKVYDGIALECDTYEIVSGEIANNQNLYVTGGAEITNVGKTTNLLTFNIFDNQNNDVTSNYNISISAGDVEVKQCPITIKSFDGRKVYDGTELKSEECKLISGALVDRFCTISGTEFAKLTKSGSLENTFTAVIVNGDGEDITDNYDITYKYGTLTVDKCPLKITSINASRDYNGQALTMPTEDNYSIEGVLPEAHLVNVKFADTVAITNVGSIDSEFTYEIRSKGTDLTENFDVTTVFGKLSINPLVLTVSNTDLTKSNKVFDGKPLTNNDIKVEEQSEIITIGDLVANDGEAPYLPINFTGTDRVEKLYISATGSITDVGTIKNTCEAVVSFTKADSNLENVTNNYEFINNLADLTVKKKRITITAGSASKPFDGEPLYKLDGATAKDSDTGEIISCVSFEEIPQLATMTVTNFVVSGEGTGVQTNIGTSENGFNYINTSNVPCVFCKGSGTIPTPVENPNNYEITIVPGKLTVTECNLVIKSNNTSKDYDGEIFDTETLLTANTEFSVVAVDEVAGVDKYVALPDGFKIIPTYYGECTTEKVPGVYDITFAAKILNANDEDVTKNYLITYSFGKATINKKVLTLSSSVLNKTYDGEAFANTEFDVSIDGLVTGDEITDINYENISVKNAGTYKNEFTYTLSNAQNYNVKIVLGTITINKTDIEIKSNNLSKTYDGETFANIEFEVSGDGLVTGDEITDINYENISVKNAGTYKNEFTYTLSNAQNYNVKIVLGTITINKADIEIKSNNLSKTYDGETFANIEFEVSGDGLVTGDEITDVNYENIRVKNAGTYKNEFTYTLSNAQNYNVKIDYGTITINKAEIDVESNGNSKKYDGKTFSLAELSAELYNVPANHSVEVIFKGYQSLINVGNATNTFDVIVYRDLEDVTLNFTIQKIPGTLEIQKAEITFTSNSVSKIYDGKEFDNNLLSVSVSNDWVSSDLFTPTYTATSGLIDVCSQISNEFTIDMKNSENYEINYNYGKLSINKANIFVTSNSASKTYDGQEFDAEQMSLSVTGDLVEGQKVEVDSYINIAGFTNVGTTKNEFTIIIYGGDIDNYNAILYFGTLTINKANVTLISNSISKTYDGNEFSLAEFNVEDNGGIVAGDDYSINDYINKDMINVGVASNEFTYTLTNAQNYNVSLICGTLTINKANATIFTNSLSKTYDGQPFTGLNYDQIGFFGSDGLNNCTFINESTNDSGSYINDISNCEIAGESNYNIIFNFGNLTINKANATLVSNSLSKTYDGIAYTSNNCSVEKLGFIDEEEDVTVTFNSAGMSNAGTMLNNFTYSLLNDNYNVQVIYGTLTIRPKNVTVYTPSGSYTKTSYTDDTFVFGDALGDAVAIGLVGEDSINVTCSGSQMEVGSSLNTIDSYTFTGSSESNYNISFVFGILTLNEYVPTV